MNKLISLFVLSILLIYNPLINTHFLYGQDINPSTTDSIQESQLVLINLKNGVEYIGEIISQTKDEVVLKTANTGVLTFKWSQISSINDVKPEEVNSQGQFFGHNLQSTRYFFGPNGFGLKKGEGYYQNVWILFNQASVGVTDFFSIGAGVVPAFLIAGSPTPVWVIPKFSIPVKKDVISIGVGGLFGTVIGDGTSFGIGFAALTLGNRNNNISVSMGYGLLDGEWSSLPVITISGMVRVSRKTYLLTENYIFIENFSLLSFGARSFAGKIGIDYGLFLPLQADLFIAIPWLGITIPFGNYKG